MLAAAGFGVCTTFGYVTVDDLSYWPVGDVQWQEKLVGNGLNIPIPSGGSPLQDGSTSWGEAVQKSFDALNAVIPDDVLTLTLVQNSSLDPGYNDGVHNVGFSQTVYGNDWSSGVVGISLSIWSGNRRTENDVFFNANKAWDAYGGAQQNGITDIRRIALHEFGHSLGLDHPDQHGQIVTAIMNSVSSDLDALQQDDIDGIVSIYGEVRPIVISKQPQDYVAPVGGTWPISLTATGSEVITYAWESSSDGGSNWSVVGGIDGPTWSYPNLQMFQDGTKVRATLTNPAGSVMSDVATLTVTASTEASSIIGQPSDVSADVGTTAVFNVGVWGSPTPSVQWQISDDGGSNWFDLFDGELSPGGPVLSGTAATRLAIDFVDSSVAGMYRAIASNSEGDATSDPATLTVTGVPTPPSITTQPASQTVFEGDPVSFTVVASGTQPFSYQWKKDGADIGGATSDTYSISSAVQADEATYSVVVTNSVDSAISDGATLTVDPVPVGPSITTQPMSAAVMQGDPASFTVVADGTAPLSYQWKKNGADIGGATSDTYSIASAQSADEGLYSVVVSNSVDSTTSDAAMLTVNVPPSITTQPVATLGYTGGSVTLSVVAGGSGPFTYQWRKAGVNIPGATGSEYTVTNAQTSSTGDYTVVITTPYGSTESTPAALTVTDARLINLSARSLAGSGGNTLIVGFAISGTGVKHIVIRGVGPKLLDYIPGPVVEDPLIRLYHAGGAQDGVLIEENDDWVSTTAANAGGFKLPAGSKDAALDVMLGPGGYTVHLVNSGPLAEALVEMYDIGGDSTAKLVNLSCRLNLGTGQTVIFGTVLSGGNRPLLVRNSGPSLAKYLQPADQPFVAQDPYLRFYNAASVLLGENDDWDASLVSRNAAAGAFPLDDASKDAADRILVPPGSFTAHASTVGPGGIIVIEMYDSP